MQKLTLKNNLTKHNIFSILTPVFSWWSVRSFHTTYKGSFHWKDVRMFILPLRHSPRPYTLIQFIYTGSVCLHHLPDLKDSFVKGKSGTSPRYHSLAWSLFIFFIFILRFWNQILTCRSVKFSRRATSCLRSRVRYILNRNSFSSSKVWYLVYGHRFFRDDRACNQLADGSFWSGPSLSSLPSHMSLLSSNPAPWAEFISLAVEDSKIYSCCPASFCGSPRCPRSGSILTCPCPGSGSALGAQSSHVRRYRVSVEGTGCVGMYGW